MTRMSEIPPELLAEMTPAVRAFVESLFVQMAEMQARMQAEIDELKAQVKKLTPKNSSVPPSTQHPHARDVAKPKPKTKRPHGGQKGHKRTIRELVPVEKCTEVISLLPTECRRCGEELKGTDAEPLRHQVWELPKIEPIITEYQKHRLTCDHCGTVTCAELPVGVPTGQFGTRLIAFTALLTGHFRQSKRRSCTFLSDLLNMPCCPASIVKMQNRAAEALEQPYEDLKCLLENERQVFMDETPTKEANQKAWLWTAVTARFAIFAIFSSRAATALPKLLGEKFKGIINCDRAKMYWRAKRLQWCWAHLSRDFQALVEHPDKQVKRLGFDLKRQVSIMFRIWHRHKSGEIPWTTFQAEMQPVRNEVNHLLLRGACSGNTRLKGMCNELYGHRDWLWTFADVEGIEPTNNAAERALRPAVIYRKLSFGTQSESGSRFIERMLTISETCRLQNRPIYPWLCDVVEANIRNEKTPLLLSTP